MACTPRAPAWRMIVSSPRRSTERTDSTPGRPNAPGPRRQGRPMRMALAPSASALNLRDVAAAAEPAIDQHRNLPPPAPSTTSGRESIVARPPSSPPSAVVR